MKNSGCLNTEFLKTRVDERLQRIAKFLLLNASFLDNPGLLKGKMGIVIFMYHYSQYSGNKLYDDYAGELIDEIYEEISTYTPVNFENGLTGIGWGFEYLIDKGFVEADGDEVLSELDSMIYKYRLNSPILIDSLSNYFGYGFYHTVRLVSEKSGNNELSTLLKKHHLIFLIDECERIFINRRFLDFNITPIKIGFILSVIWFLLQIYKLHLLPWKVKEIFKAIPEYLEFIQEQDITIAEKYMLNFLTQEILYAVDDNDIRSIYQILCDKYTDGALINRKIENIIYYQVSMTCMNLIYSMSHNYVNREDISFEEAFKLIDDETIWNDTIDEINKDNLSLDGFAGIGLYLLNNVSIHKN